LQGLVKASQPNSNEVQLGIKQMKIRLLTGLLTLLMPAMVMAGEYGLTVDRVKIDTGDFVKEGIGYNGASPGPVMRFKEGENVKINVTNNLDEMTSIHWHGLILPFDQDGVPGISFPGIKPGETFTYEFPIQQAGTYWFHSHSGFQEPDGAYGAIVIEPEGREPFRYDREYVVQLTDKHPHSGDRIMRNLKMMPDYYNREQQTVGEFFSDVSENGLMNTVRDRMAWGDMRMMKADVEDLQGFTGLINGKGPDQNWTGIFEPGERIRLRFINSSAMTYFDVRIPGLKMTVVAADGLHVKPVSVDEFRIAVAETYDVIVEPDSEQAYTVFAQSMDRTGYARGTLAVQEGLSAPVPSPDPRPLIAMGDMGMDHGSMGGMDHGNMAGMDQGNMAGMDHGSMQGGMAGMDHSQMAGMDHSGMAGMAGNMQAHPASETNNPLVDMQTMTPTHKLDDPGIGLRDNGRRVLTYSDLRSTFPDPDGREPSRTIELHLTGHMEKFSWSFDGIKFSDAEPLRLKYGERVRITLVNDTMMTHPIHLHGMWSDLEDANGNFLVRKHTIDMPPGSKRSYRVTADALGRWAYHCHLLLHMEMGMFREVRVDE